MPVPAVATEVAREAAMSVVHAERNGVHPEHVLLGRDMMDLLSSGPAPYEYSTFVVPDLPHDMFGGVLAGKRVHCIPWMAGCTVVPDTDVQRDGPVDIDIHRTVVYNDPVPIIGSCGCQFQQ
jgi:hypothetical protein